MQKHSRPYNTCNLVDAITKATHQSSTGVMQFKQLNSEKQIYLFGFFLVHIYIKIYITFCKQARFKMQPKTLQLTSERMITLKKKHQKCMKFCTVTIPMCICFSTILSEV